MTEDFEIDVLIDNAVKKFDAEFRQQGYSYKIAVWVDGDEVIFEPDEERKFRAVSINHALVQNKKFVELVRMIGERLNEIFDN